MCIAAFDDLQGSAAGLGAPLRHQFGTPQRGHNILSTIDLVDHCRAAVRRREPAPSPLLVRMTRPLLLQSIS
jgi:hypothetical protein